jgi:soluble cytochrome b562
MNVFPQNFDLLASGEDQIRQLSKAAIEASEDLTLHATMIERAMNMLDHMSKRRPHSDEDELVLLMLAARLFNSGASSMKLLMGGYYQSTVMVTRDILETTFLLDYFHSNRDQIAVWRTCDEKKRSREFGAMKIRMALDDRDGFTERKREAAYNLLCQLGTHPTYTGFQMLQAKGSNLTIVGPFFEPASLDAVLSEFAKTIMQAGSQARHAKERDIADYRISLDYLTTQADWSDRFFGTKMDRGKIAEIQAAVDEIERRRGAL